MEIGPPVLEKKIFEGVFTIYGHGGHIGHVTSILLPIFHFLVPESFHTKFGSEWHSSLGENLVRIFVCTRPSGHWLQ